MEEIKLPDKVQFITKKDNPLRAVVTIEPLYPGYGLTLGNSLRRVLLSSLPGAAVTAMKIEGVDHEFTTIPGVKQNVVEIMLALKKLRLKLHSEGPVKLKLSKKGKGNIKASDFDIPSDIELVDPDFLIAKATDPDAKVNMEITVEKGRGYLPVEQRDKDNVDLGTIIVDAIFTPIKKVKINIENVRVGQQTNFDKLILEIETDGTITAKEAFDQAARILIDHYKIFVEAEETTEEELKEQAKAEEESLKAEEKDKEEAAPEDELMTTPIEELKMSRRTTNALYNNDVRTLGDLVKMSREEISELRGLGGKALEEIEKVAHTKGLLFQDEKE